MSRLFTYALCILGGWFPGFVLGAFRVPEHTLKNDAFWLMASDVPALVGALLGLIAALVMHLEDAAAAQEATPVIARLIKRLNASAIELLMRLLTYAGLNSGCWFPR